MPAEKISLEEAKQDKLFYFVATVVVYREADGRCLILKRSVKEKVHPGKYCVPGGKLEWKDLDMSRPTRMNGGMFDFENAVADLLVREAREEAGIEIEQKLHYINSSAFVRPDGIPVVLIKFAAKYKTGDVHLEEGAFDDYAWVSGEEVKTYDCIDGIKEEVRGAIHHYKKENKGDSK